MRKDRLRTHLLLFTIVLTIFVFRAYAGDWPQQAHDARRSGFTSEEIHPPYKVAWRHPFLPERPARRTQPIIYQGKVYVGTQQGTMYCFDAKTGEVLWKYPGAGSIQHSAACANGKVFFTSLDGNVYALDAATGERKWQTPTGSALTVTPCLTDDLVLVGSRRGTFFALRQTVGTVAWSKEMGAPILNSAAYDEGVVYFGTEDMHMHALNTANGDEKWVSEKLYGMSFKDYHPVIHKGYVLIRPMTSYEADIYAGYSPYGSWPDDLPGGWWAVWTEAPKPLPNFRQRYDLATMERAGRMPQMLLAAQEPVIEHFTKNPSDQDLFVLDTKTGKQAFVAPHFRVNSMHGAVTPPCEDISGTLIVPWVHLNQCWARYDIEKNRLVEFIIPPTPTNADENMNVSCGGRYVYIFHTQEGNANHTGIYDLREKAWRDNPSPGVKWYDNLQSGNHPVSIAAGHYYHILFYTLVARTSQEGAK
jgi:hypothetical protein